MHGWQMNEKGWNWIGLGLGIFLCLVVDAGSREHFIPLFVGVIMMLYNGIMVTDGLAERISPYL